MDRDTVKAVEGSSIMPTYDRFDLVPETGEGAVLRDRDGEEYLDMLSGIAVNVLGHCHPRVVGAIRGQASRLVHCSNFYYVEGQSRLSELLTDISGLGSAFFCNSGTEAVEAALKLARRSADGHEIVALRDSFHGRTLGSLSATWKGKYRKPFEPLVPGFRFAEKTAEAVKGAVSGDTAAVLIEPVQGEGGVLEVPDDVVEAARDACDENDAFLVFDEVQTGVGRTGKFFGHEWFDAEPDAVAMAKGLGNGFPVGALLAREGAYLDRGEHASTFGGNPLACASALATVETVVKEGLPGRARDEGRYLRDELESLDKVKGTRGLGLLIGAELDVEAEEVVDHAFDEGVLLDAVTDTTLRLAPPLTVEREHLDRAVEVIDEA